MKSFLFALSFFALSSGMALGSPSKTSTGVPYSWQSSSASTLAGKYWMSLAAGLGSDDKYVYAAAGLGAGESKEEAEAEAVSQCREQKTPAGEACKAVYSSDEGCAYIAIGSKTGDSKFAVGATEKEALDKCTDGGYACAADNVIGGCLK